MLLGLAQVTQYSNPSAITAGTALVIDPIKDQVLGYAYPSGAYVADPTALANPGAPASTSSITNAIDSATADVQTAVQSAAASVTSLFSSIPTSTWLLIAAGVAAVMFFGSKHKHSLPGARTHHHPTQESDA